MRIEVDLDRCVGAGMCALTAPAVFTQDDDGFSVVLAGQDTAADVPPMAREAARACPVSAVSLLHED
ncbi:ferredoxin [Streptomyces sp. NBC_01283]|uniref:ferredoxin n=1 Tax=Streptomyces sp. NBC_01283 TaxID=2903812 RepID=UPI00352C4FDD|nr:ferredoxin [Streptomyces sp. NBC_01283]WSL21313.1 ferredoxin [Streptomyces sp. NBC_01283]